MTEQIVEIDSIVEDKEIYPRNQFDWMTVLKYQEAMKAGAKFPPIAIGLYAGRRYLIDGKHRIESNKKNKKIYINSEIKTYTNRKDMFADAVKSNTTHGRILSIQERARAIMMLQQMGFSDETVTEITYIPVDKLEQFVAGRLVSSITGKEIIVKAPLNHLSGTIVQDDVLEGQNIFASVSQEQILDEMIEILEQKTINLKNPTILNKVKIINQLTKELILSHYK